VLHNKFNKSHFLYDKNTYIKSDNQNIKCSVFCYWIWFNIESYLKYDPCITHQTYNLKHGGESRRSLPKQTTWRMQPKSKFYPVFVIFLFKDSQFSGQTGFYFVFCPVLHFPPVWRFNIDCFVYICIICTIHVHSG
jgi:hypothetical protein